MPKGRQALFAEDMSNNYNSYNNYNEYGYNNSDRQLLLSSYTETELLTFVRDILIQSSSNKLSQRERQNLDLINVEILRRSKATSK
jgi:hypothetical protein